MVPVIGTFARISKLFPTRNNNHGSWEQYPTKLAQTDLEQFNAAVKAEDRQKLATLVGVIVSEVDKANTNTTNRVIPGLRSVVDSISKLSEQQDWCGRWSLRYLVTGLDGLRDNESYYRLEAANEWIEKRLPVTSGRLNADLSTTQSQIVDARDFLDNHAQVYVKCIKDLVKLTEDSKNEDAIKVTAHELSSKLSHDGFEKLKQKSVDALNSVKELQDSLKTI
jgi:hypothetical protein